MYVSKENERLYPATWEYNAARIMTELARIVANNGGKVKPCRKAIISNRTITAALHEYRDKIERYTAASEGSTDEKMNQARAVAIKDFRDKIEALEAVNNDPITVTHTSYIQFVLDGYYYSYNVESNPFFDFHYYKTPVNNNRYSQDAVAQEDKKEWLYDCFFYATCSNADCVEAANLIYNMLVNSKCSYIRRDKKQRRVPNTYDGGWHYETVYERERIATIDF